MEFSEDFFLSVSLLDFLYIHQSIEFVLFVAERILVDDKNEGLKTIIV